MLSPPINPLAPLLLVGFGAIAFCWHLYRVRGRRDLGVFVGIVVPIAVIIEFIGIHSGSYTYIWGNDILDSIFVGLGWITNIYPNMHIAFSLTTNKNYFKDKFINPNKRLLVSILSAFFAVMYDLFLDPLAVYLGIWTWYGHGPYFGVPIGNFVGWWLITFFSVYSYLFLRYNDKKFDLRVWMPLLVIVDISLVVLGLILNSLFLSLFWP